MYRERPERGTKRTCLNCGARFYDLMRVPPVCPACGTEFVVVVQPPPVPRQNQKWKSFGKDNPARTREAEESEKLQADDFPSDDDDREIDDEPEEDAEGEDEPQAGDEEEE